MIKPITPNKLENWRASMQSHARFSKRAEIVFNLLDRGLANTENLKREIPRALNDSLQKFKDSILDALILDRGSANTENLKREITRSMNDSLQKFKDSILAALK
jgi:hypothetical protein